jgi:IclR-like helix-turn-helix domain-containing protein
MSGAADGDISIVLSPIQVEQVVRAASRSTAPGVAALISGSVARRNHGPAASARGSAGAAATRPVSVDRRLSQSLLRGLSLLSCFGSTEEERGIVELARQAGMSASTAHRYALTLIELGLLERSQHSRKYRLPADMSR